MSFSSSTSTRTSTDISPNASARLRSASTTSHSNSTSISSSALKSERTMTSAKTKQALNMASPAPGSAAGWGSASHSSSFSPSSSQTHINSSSSLNSSSSFIHRSSSCSTYPHTSPATSSSSSTNSARPRMPRSNSHLRRGGGPGTLVIPIPPTLVNSPHLQSPNSVFRRPHPGLAHASPGVEEERWLRDTVPMGSNGSIMEPLDCGGFVGSTSTVSMGGGQDGRPRAGSVTSPISPAFSLLPSSLPRQAVYTHEHGHPSRERG